MIIFDFEKKTIGFVPVVLFRAPDGARFHQVKND